MKRKFFRFTSAACILELMLCLFCGNLTKADELSPVTHENQITQQNDENTDKNEYHFVTFEEFTKIEPMEKKLEYLDYAKEITENLCDGVLKLKNEYLGKASSNIAEVEVSFLEAKKFEKIKKKFEFYEISIAENFKLISQFENELRDKIAESISNELLNKREQIDSWSRQLLASPEKYLKNNLEAGLPYIKDRKICEKIEMILSSPEEFNTLVQQNVAVAKMYRETPKDYIIQEANFVMENTHLKADCCKKLKQEKLLDTIYETTIKIYKCCRKLEKVLKGLETNLVILHKNTLKSK